MRNATLVGFFLLVVLIPGIGQEATRPFQQLTLQDGLPNPSVLDIRQDRRGFMWFATFGGIARYDGYTMQVYHPSLGSPDTASVRGIPVLGEGPDGELLVGYAKGDCKLYRYDPTRDRFQPYLYDTLEQRSLIPLDDAVSSLFTDSRGRLWIGTYGIGVFLIDGADSIHLAYNYDDPAASLFPTSDVLGDMVEDEGGNIWMPTLDGVVKWEAATGEFRLFPFSEKTVARPNECWSLHYQPPRTLWIGSNHAGLVRFDTEHETFQTFSLPSAIGADPVYINDLARLPGGKLALAMGRDQQVAENYLFDPFTERWSALVPREDVFGFETSNYVDRAGSLWVATWQDGVLKYDPNRERFRYWSPYLPRAGTLDRPRPFSLAEDMAGRIWIGTTDFGLFAWEPATNEYRRYAMPKKFLDAEEERGVVSVHVADPEALWLAVKGQARYFRPATGRYDSLSFSWAGERIEGIALWRTGQDDYWLSSWTFNGFCELETTATDRLAVKYCYRRADSTSLWGFRGITDIVRSPSGHIWIGTNQDGLYIFDPINKTFDHRLPRYGVWDIHFDRRSIAWLATHSNGLKGYDPDRRRVIHLDAETNRAIGLVSSTLADRHGLLWMMNATGLIQFDPTTQRVIRRISAANWQSIEASGYHRDTRSLRTRNGSMVFTDRYGAVYFHPDSLSLDTLPPRLAFTDFKLFNESVAPGPDSPLPTHIARAPAIRLRHWQNDLSVQFAALHYKDPAEYRYRYRLLPTNEDWIDIGNRREVFFASLSPGQYTLWVQAANADGTWNEVGIRLPITIRQPWWDTGWAYALYALIVLVVSYLVYRFFLGRRLREAENRRLRELDVFKNRVFTNITHEFRTPLTLILGVAERLRSNIARMFHADLGTIERQGNRLLRLVNSMLDLAQLEAGRLRLEPVQSDLHFFLRYVTQAFESLARDKELDLHWSIPEAPYVMDFDPARLEQVVTNLLSNAIKFTPVGGRVHLSGRATEAETYQIEVSDTGPGIAPREQEQIFHRFFRASDAEPESPTGETESRTGRVHKGEGTGIGLALCRELVQLMGGSLTVTSQPGQGARFTVELPVSRRAKPQALPLPDPIGAAFAEFPPGLAGAVETVDQATIEAVTADEERPQVLIVEDHSELRTYLRGCLEDSFRVLEGEDGRRGLDLALEHTPDLIVSDVMMPGMDGFELCGQLKEDRRTSHIPVVLLTAKVDAASRLAGRRRGADAYLTKPFLPDELRLVVRNQLAHRRRLREHYQSLVTGEHTNPPAADPPEEAAFVAEIRAYVLAHLEDTDLNVEALAGALHMSRAQLFRKLKSLAGVSPTELLRQIRLSRAKELLRTTELLISEVAYRCGYSDPGFFSRVFRDTFGVTPTEFREQ